MSAAVDYTLCSYCRGYTHRELDGTEHVVIKHGEARLAANCRCECHADQVVTKTSFDLTMTVTLDVKEAFLRWCEENGYTQADFADDADRDVYGDGESFAQWWADDILDDCGGDVTGVGVIAYQSDVDGFDFNPLADVDRNRLLNLAIPLLPPDPDWAPPLSGAQLGMEPLFKDGEI